MEAHCIRNRRGSRDNFLAENLTIANDFNALIPSFSKARKRWRCLATATAPCFETWRLLGNQDTLYSGSRNCNGPNGEGCAPARHYFSELLPSRGTSDFIFGDGKAVFERCEIHNTKHAGGYVTAQGKHYAIRTALRPSTAVKAHRRARGSATCGSDVPAAPMPAWFF